VTDDTSPRPWGAKVQGSPATGQWVDLIDFDGEVPCFSDHRNGLCVVSADAALIVTAVNAHEGLLAEADRMAGIIRETLGWCDKIIEACSETNSYERQAVMLAKHLAAILRGETP